MPYDSGDHDGAQVFPGFCFAESWGFPDWLERSGGTGPGGATSGFASQPQSGRNRAVYRACTTMECAGVRR